MKFKKRKKSSRMHGKGMGTHGGGARKKRKGSGHKGGKGMAGTGKRADQKKTLVTKLYHGKYFGKQGITSKGTRKDKRKRINLQDIQDNLEKYGKKSGDKWEINLQGYKILGGREKYKLRNKLIIKAKSASQAVIDQIEKLGGKVSLSPKFAKEKKQTPAIKKEGGEVILSGK